MSDWIWIAMCALFVIIGPLPPILQPLYDVKKFLAKEQVTPNKVQDFYVMVFLLFTIVTGAMFFAGMDLLLVIFSLTLAETFLVLAAYSSGSAYSQIGAQRELYVAMAFEPIILLMAICYYMHTGSFSVSGIVESGSMSVIPLLGVFVAFMFGLTQEVPVRPQPLASRPPGHREGHGDGVLWEDVRVSGDCALVRVRDAAGHGRPVLRGRHLGRSRGRDRDRAAGMGARDLD